MRWVHVGNAVLCAGLALAVAYQYGTQRQEAKDQALLQAMRESHDEQERHALILQTDLTYYHDADAMGLTYFNALRDACFKEKR